MVKNIGLSQLDEKMLEFLPFPKNINPAGSLYNQSKGFYFTFRAAFGNGYKTILGHNIPNFNCLGPCIVNYHFAIELMVKSLIHLKVKPLPKKKDLEIHTLIKLLKIALPFYPELNVIINNSEYNHLLTEITHMGIRYTEGTIALRHNNKGNWQDKKPLQELSEAMEDIFSILKNTFEKSR